MRHARRCYFAAAAMRKAPSHDIFAATFADAAAYAVLPLARLYHMLFFMPLRCLRRFARCYAMPKMFAMLIAVIMMPIMLPPLRCC